MGDDPVGRGEPDSNLEKYENNETVLWLWCKIRRVKFFFLRGRG